MAKDNAQRKYIDTEMFAKRIEASPAFGNMAFEGELLQRVVLDILGNQPTADVVEVVRCKDCIHFDTYFRECESEYGKHHIHTENDFCSYGERRDT
jgi:hypothetical protein